MREYGTAPLPPIAPPRVTSQDVLGKCEYFAAIQLWPPKAVVDPEAWLSNFSDADKEHAVHLLNSFMYFSDRMLDALFRGAFLSISSKVVTRGQSLAAAQSEWRRFVSTLLVTRVEGEEPNPVDSGYLFQRKARQVLLLDETQIRDPADVLGELAQGTRRPVLFVDDFLGTGEQLVATWRRRYPLGSGGVSFAQVAGAGITEFFYCPPIATQRGLDAAARLAPEIQVFPGQLLTNRHSILAADSVMWPPDLLSTGRTFVEDSSRGPGISTDPSLTEYWAGYQGLGMALAFAHGTPDATVPLLHWRENGWRPLVPKV